MLPKGNTLKDLFDYADIKWHALADGSEKPAMKDILAEDLFGIQAAQRRQPETVRLTESQILVWMRAVKRIAAQEPLQYVTGLAAFYGLLFDVNPSVLIPRPETEEMVDLILRRFAPETSLHVIDFCTGSGCIPVTLKKQRPGWQVQATDISAAALDTARINAVKHGAPVDFFMGDLLTGSGVPEGRWDLLVSNPPYVAQSEEKDMAPHVLNHEPHLALFVPDRDAVMFYRRLAAIAAERLNPGGSVWTELNPLHADESAALFRDKGFAVRLHRDLSGKDRFLEARHTDTHSNELH